jgi:hypothetical protein
MPTRDDFRTKHAGPTKPLARTFGMAKSGVRMIRGKSPDKACQAMRADSVDDIARKCEELGLKPKTNRRRKPAPSPLIVRMSRRNVSTILRQSCLVFRLERLVGMSAD